MTRLTDDELEDVLLVRMMVESAVVRGFGLPPGLGARLGVAVERLESAAAAGDWPAYAEADILFHETLVEAARSPRLTETHRRAMRQLRLYLVSVDLDESEAGPARPHVREHRRMAEFLRADEREEAATLLIRHLEDAWTALVGR